MTPVTAHPARGCPNVGQNRTQCVNVWPTLHKTRPTATRRRTCGIPAHAILFAIVIARGRASLRPARIAICKIAILRNTDHQLTYHSPCRSPPLHRPSITYDDPPLGPWNPVTASGTCQWDNVVRCPTLGGMATVTAATNADPVSEETSDASISLKLVLLIAMAVIAVALCTGVMALFAARYRQDRQRAQAERQRNSKKNGHAAPRRTSRKSFKRRSSSQPVPAVSSARDGFAYGTATACGPCTPHRIEFIAHAPRIGLNSSHSLRLSNCRPLPS